MNARYLIVGGGMTADAAVKAIRKVDADGSIVLVSRERTAPYKRPPLSKGLWKGDDEAKIALDTEAAGAQLLLGRTVTGLDTAARTVTLDDDTVIGYERLLLATGARARQLRGVPASDRVVAYRGVEDYHRVRELAVPPAKAVVIGGGFIGSEMAAALVMAGASVTMIFPEPAIGGGRFPSELARTVTADYERRGVRVLAGRTLGGAAASADGLALELDDGTKVEADFAVVGVGAVPNDELAAQAGLMADNGIVVDECLRALGANGGGVVEGVYAAGDVASFPWSALGRRARIEHEDNAYSMGAAAGRAMAASLADAQGGDYRPYDHLPFFYSDLFDAGYEAVGLLDPRLDVVEDWRKPGEEGVAYYLEEGLVRGVLLWNTWGQVDAARALIEDERQYAPADLVGRLPLDD